MENALTVQDLIDSLKNLDPDKQIRILPVQTGSCGFIARTCNSPNPIDFVEEVEDCVLIHTFEDPSYY